MGNPVVHFEIAGPDMRTITDFYTSLFGWRTSDVPDMPYSMVTAGEGGAGGGIGPTPDGSPGYVTFYVSVDDVPAAIEKAGSLGGSTIVGPIDIPSGQIALLSDPEGHTFGVWAGSMEGGSGESAGTPVIWFEVMGKDGGALRSFYCDLFGWETEAFEGMDYGVVSADANGGGIGGGIGSAQEPGPSYQTVYAAVDDVPGTLEKAESLGAKIVVPTMDIPNGPTVALFADPQGHTFGLVKPQPM